MSDLYRGFLSIAPKKEVLKNKGDWELILKFLKILVKKYYGVADCKKVINLLNFDNLLRVSSMSYTDYHISKNCDIDKSISDYSLTSFFVLRDKNHTIFHTDTRLINTVSILGDAFTPSNSSIDSKPIFYINSYELITKWGEAIKSDIIIFNISEYFKDSSKYYPLLKKSYINYTRALNSYKTKGV
jgi:hypothetical protein